MNYFRFIPAAVSIVILSFFVAEGADTYDGYTFVFGSNTARLYDMDKTPVNTWVLPEYVSACADLLRDSSIIYMTPAGGDAGENLQGIPLPGGRLQILDWDGNVTWDYTYAGPDLLPHHDIEPVYRTNNPEEKPTILLVAATEWGDKIVELRPKGTDDADILWEWKASDHRCTGNCNDSIGVIDESKRTKGSAGTEADVMHTNNVSYNPVLDQIIINMKGFYEFIVVDHSTTTEEARGSTGGICGRGGAILYRWGNPDTYGVSGETFFKGQHGSCWVPLTMPGTSDSIPGGGNFLAVDNENERVVEIECPGDKDGIYPREKGCAFEPEGVLWTYTMELLQPMEGSIQKLPNGNYFMCTGGFTGKTYVYEVNREKKIVWQLSDFGNSTEACRYAYSYLKGPGTSNRPGDERKKTLPPIRSIGYSIGRLTVFMHQVPSGARLSVCTLDGRIVIPPVTANSTAGWYLPCTLPGGLYLCRIQSATGMHCTRFPVE